MPDKEPNSQNDFMIEKIKARPINRKKLIRRTIITAVMAVLFGTVACVTFLILEPVISNQLYPEEEPQPVVFPEDQNEMSPEEMLAENLPDESPSPAPGGEDSSGETLPELSGLTKEQIQEMIDGADRDLEDYAGLYAALQELIYNGRTKEDGESVIPALCQYMIPVKGVTSSIDWFDDVQERSNQATGVIVADNGVEFLILVDYSSLKNAENLVVELSQGQLVYRIDAALKGVDKDTELAIVAVNRDSIPAGFLEEGGLAVVALGSSAGNKMTGTPVIAMGSPMGAGDSIGYGMITYAGSQMTGPDRNYRLLMTDINGSKNAEGFLFNLKGQMIGVITDSPSGSDTGNLIHAYGITEIRRIIEKLSNGNTFAYLGITGTDVTAYAHSDLGVPYGAYVTRVEMDSPAMLAGMQVGDVILAINGNSVINYSSYCNQLMILNPGDTVELTVSRQSQSEYREMTFTVELGEL